jgi:hypothetical protein
MEMPDLTQSSDPDNYVSGDVKPSRLKAHQKGFLFKALILLVVFALGGGSGYLVGNLISQAELASRAVGNQDDSMILMQQINPVDGFKIAAVFGDVGPQLVAVGAIDVPAFISLYQQQNKPLTNVQLDNLTMESANQVMINAENANFLLNFFWALGLTNQNDILTDGPMVSGGMDKIGGYASVGGWTIGAKSAIDLYASNEILNLTDKQQNRLLEVATGVYRPCCNNPTYFPDCNHGMAMLGLLELMASQDASTDEMFETAKYVTAFWYPQQMLEIATAFKTAKNVDFLQADARTVVGRQFASISGFQAVHQWLAQNGLLEQAPSSSGSCGVQ